MANINPDNLKECPECHAAFVPGWISLTEVRQYGAEAMTEWEDVTIKKLVRCLSCFTLLYENESTERVFRDF